ncbi:type I 3-dehydroquinate dehydratase [Halonotius sp. GCM10025705]|uniref:type I 3-dehydroquinate dehydratase n=1 Tax=Halonotius sp. GCM10025705 TaxID=3252678 RepID=UPI00360715D4
MPDFALSFDEFVLAASTDTLTDEPAAREHADAVEFRLDLADDPLEQLSAYDGELPIIATNRAAWEAGGASDETERLHTLETALEDDAVAAIDLECRALDGGVAAADTETAQQVRTSAREAGVAVIASIHDFEATPPREELTALLDRAADAGTVGKLATTAHDRGDALALLSVTHEATAAGKTVATMGMGAAGQHTRAVAPIYGSAIGYAPVEAAEATAPGQYPLATLRELVDGLATPTNNDV